MSGKYSLHFHLRSAEQAEEIYHHGMQYLRYHALLCKMSMRHQSVAMSSVLRFTETNPARLQKLHWHIRPKVHEFWLQFRAEAFQCSRLCRVPAKAFHHQLLDARKRRFLSDIEPGVLL